MRRGHRVLPKLENALHTLGEELIYFAVVTV